jgi:hypothetical protein
MDVIRHQTDAKDWEFEALLWKISARRCARLMMR